MHKKITSILLALCMIVSCIVVSGITASANSADVTTVSASADVQSTSASYGLASKIEDGNILHCFNWTLNDIKNWTDTSDPTSNAWSGVRKWDKGDGVYDGVGTYGYWCSDRYASTSDVYLILYTGNFANSSPTGTQGFRPCIEVTQ